MIYILTDPRWVWNESILVKGTEEQFRWQDIHAFLLSLATVQTNHFYIRNIRGDSVNSVDSIISWLRHQCQIFFL